MVNKEEASGSARVEMDRHSKSAVSPSRVRIPPPASDSNNLHEDKKLTDSENEVIEPNADSDAESDADEYDYNKFLSILKYLKVLIEAYPTPINQTEIAKRASVSKALISKKRKDIQEYCDLKTMAYEKKYMLKEEEGIVTELFLGSLLYDDLSFLQSLLKSEYLDSKMSFSDLYTTLTDTFSEYNFDHYYSEEDIKWVYSFLKNRIINYDHNADDIDYEHWIFTLININFFGGSFIGWRLLEKYYLFYEYVLSNDLSSFEKSDFLQVINIRDKTYYFTLDNIHTHKKLCEKFINILNIEDEEEYNSAIKGSKIISKYVLTYIFTNFSNTIYEVAENSGITLDENFKEMTRNFEK